MMGMITARLGSRSYFLQPAILFSLRALSLAVGVGRGFGPTGRTPATRASCAVMRLGMERGQTHRGRRS